MKTAIPILVASLVVALAPNARAQSGGMFGPRDLGGSLRPGVRTFGSGVQTTPGGSFVGVGRPGGANMFSTPWRHPVQPLPYVPLAVSVAPVATPVAPVPGEVPPWPVVPQPDVVPELPLPPELLQPPSGELPGEQPSNLAPEAPPAMPAPGDTTTVAPPSRAVRVVAANQIMETPSSGYLPRVSQRLTEIAHQRGIAGPGGIQVFLVHGTAVLRGVVASPHDRELLANVAGLEPGIGPIDNQLTVASGGF